MRIHSDILNRGDVSDAAQAAGIVTFVRLSTVGSRSRARAFDVILSGTSSHRTQWHGGAGERAATWDEWGMFLGRLFELDPDAHCGKNSYQSAAHYHWMTGDRFRSLTPPYQHKRHRWEPTPVVGSSRERGFYEWQCSQCEAISRREISGRSFDELAVR